MAGLVCVDASLVISILVVDSFSIPARALWRDFAEQDIGTVAPPLLFVEVTSVLRQSVYFKRISEEDGERAFSAFLDLDIVPTDPSDLQRRAWDLAKKYNRPRAYDAQYLAVASTLGCDLWTADERLVNSVNDPWVRWVGDFTIPSLR